MDHELVQLLLVSAVVMGISHTVAREKIFEPLREGLGGKRTWFGYLVSCPYCASHWLAFGIVPLTGLAPIQLAHDWGLATRVLEWFLASILVTIVAAFLRIAFWFVDESQSLVRAEKKTFQRGLAEKWGYEQEHAEQVPAPHALRTSAMASLARTSAERPVPPHAEAGSQQSSDRAEH